MISRQNERLKYLGASIIIGKTRPDIGYMFSTCENIWCEQCSCDALGICKILNVDRFIEHYNIPEHDN